MLLSTVPGMFIVHNFHQLHLYSTKSPNQSIKSPNQTISNYLVNNLGFSQEQAHSISSKIHFKNPNYSKFCNNANSVVDFLKQHGFDDTLLKNAVSFYPRILACKVEKTLKPKFKLFQEHGISGSNLVSAISANPKIVGRNLDHSVLDLKAVLGSDGNVTKFLSRSSLYSTSSLENLVSNAALLNKEYGVHIDVIRNNILKQPICFLRKPDFFRNVLVRVEEELGIPRTSGAFFYGIQLLNNSKECIESKCRVFRNFGWSKYDVSELMRRNPSAFHLSEENIKKKLGFLMTELGYDPVFLASHSALVSYSLEKRMVPRHRVLSILKEKGLLDFNFYSAVIKTESQFLKRLVEPYMEAVPGLLQVYQNNSKDSSKVEVVSR